MKRSAPGPPSIRTAPALSKRLAVYGGQGMGTQLAELRRGAQVIVDGFEKSTISSAGRRPQPLELPKSCRA